MRLIDADALTADLIGKGFYPALVKRAIEDAPTIDVVDAKKYRKAILVLQAIAQRTGCYSGSFGGYDEWSQAEAFIDCRIAARRCLKKLGENLIMPNKKEEDND